MRLRVLLVALVAGVVACGDDSEPKKQAPPKPLSRLDYEERVEDAAAEFWKTSKRDIQVRDGASNARNAKALAQASARMERFREQLAALRPPPKMSTLHRQYLGAMRVVLFEYRDVLALAREGDYDTLDSLQAGALSTSSLRQLAAAERGLRGRGIALPWTGRLDPWLLQEI